MTYEMERRICEACEGTGYLEGLSQCIYCDGTGKLVIFKSVEKEETNQIQED